MLSLSLFLHCEDSASLTISFLTPSGSAAGERQPSSSSPASLPSKLSMSSTGAPMSCMGDISSSDMPSRERRGGRARRRVGGARAQKDLSWGVAAIWRFFLSDPPVRLPLFGGTAILLNDF